CLAAQSKQPAIDITDVLAAEKLYQFAEVVRVGQIFIPVVGQPVAHYRQGANPVGGRRTFAVGDDEPFHPDLYFFDGVGEGKCDRNNENRDDDQQGNGCCHDIVAMTCLKQAFVQRPAGKADDQRGEDLNYEATKKINSGDKDED